MANQKSNTSILYCRLTHSDKLPDRFLTTQVYAPADPETQHKGTIFSQVEILNPWFPTSQIGQTIINTIIREYYRGADTSELNNLESALKKVNETLAQVTQSGETDWIGNLHGVLLLINGNDIHISQTGRTQAYLFRDNKVNHITEGLAGESEPHPLRTFSNITSGTLHEGDRIIIANPIFYKTIDLDSIKHIIGDNPPSAAAQEFAKILKVNKANAGEALILYLLNKRDIEAMPIEIKNDTVYLDESNIGSIFHGIRGSIGKINSGSVKKTTNKIGSALKAADDKFDHYITPHIRKIGTATISAAKKSTDKVINKATRGRGIQQDSFLYKLSGWGRNIKDKSSPFIQNTKQKFGFGEEISRQTRTRRYGIWGAALIIVLIILIIITWRYQTKHPSNYSNYNALQDETAQLGDQFNRIKLLAAYNDKTQALKEIGDLFTELNKISQKRELPPSLLELKKQALDELGGLTNTKNISNFNRVADIGDRPNLVGNADVAYLANNDNIVQAPANKDADLKTYQKIIGMCYDSDNKITYLNTKKGMKKISADMKIKDAPLLSGQWLESSLFKYYDGNLYFLDQSRGIISKYPSGGKGFAESEEFSKPQNAELKDGIDLAINGNVLVLFKNGSIVKYSRTGRENIELSGLPASNFVFNPKNIFADSNDANVVVLHMDVWSQDTWHLTFLTRTGKYKQSYFIPQEYQNYKSIYYSSKDKTLWIETSKELLKAKIDI